jgi:acyl dehydratase
VSKLGATMHPCEGTAMPIEPDRALKAFFESMRAGRGVHDVILYGMCKYNFVCKLRVDDLPDGAVARVREDQGRPSGSVYPGETIQTSVWVEANTSSSSSWRPRSERVRSCTVH